MFRPTVLTITARCFVLASSVALTGCVTAGDLEKLETRLSDRVQAMESRSRSQVAKLGTELQGILAGQDVLRDDLARVLGEAKAAMQGALEIELGLLREQLHAIEGQGRSQREALQSKLEELRTAYEGVRQEMAQAFDQSADVFERIVAGTDRLRAQIAEFHRGLMQSLAGAYHAEEAALRERLKAIAHVRQRLEVVAAPVETGSHQLTEQELLIEHSNPETVE